MELGGAHLNITPHLSYCSQNMIEISVTVK